MRADDETSEEIERKIRALEKWADEVDERDLVPIDLSALDRIVELVDERERIDGALVDAIQAARAAGHTWGQIGLSLGVSKQAAQQRYGEVSPSGSSSKG